MTDDPQLREQIAATVANVEALSVELRAIAGENRQDLQAIAKNLKDVSEALKAIVGTTGTNVDKELATLQAATDTLDRTMQNVESISAKVDHGEGTVGKLLNDSTTIDSVNDTLGQVNGLVSDVSRLQTEVYYRGDYFLGTAPSDGSMETNPVSGEGRNVVGLRIQPREDYWYQVELVSHPIGTVSYEDRAISQAGTVPDFGTAWREYVVRPDYRFSFQFAKRINNLVLRFGVKESSGGVGADWELLHDHAVLSADLYDFTYGSWPLMDGTPNLELTARVVPWRHVYFEGGMDNVILGARHGFVTGFAGGGFTFDDQDLKYVLAALPLPM
jgi:phospholipid/cholesterol/gamma-HCH transport system substrate-binding protein